MVRLTPTIGASVMRAAILALCAALIGAPAAASDDEEGYYYPPVGSSEVFDRTLAETPPAPAGVRVEFVTHVTRQQFEQAYAPRFALVIKGAQKQELIVIALDDAVFATLYRARAVMAQLSASARTTAFFVENDLSEIATFYDMLKIMGFRTLTLTDGATWSHRVEFR
jgi:hypothetical protein